MKFWSFQEFIVSAHEQTNVVTLKVALLSVNTRFNFEQQTLLKAQVREETNYKYRLELEATKRCQKEFSNSAIADKIGIEKATEANEMVINLRRISLFAVGDFFPRPKGNCQAYQDTSQQCEAKKKRKKRPKLDKKNYCARSKIANN